MEQRTKKKFQVIGACAKTQTLSLDEEIRLTEGIPYNLDFFQNFSVRQINGQTIEDISSLALWMMVDELEYGIKVIHLVNQEPTELDDRERMQVRKALAKSPSSMIRWEEKHNKISGKKAAKKLEKVLRDLGGGWIRMNELMDRERLELLYSMLGHKILSGDEDALEYLYVRAWRESPALLRIISLLQQNLTASDIAKAEDGRYSTEFYYYWGMLNLGEQSSLIFKDTDIAQNCFNKIRSVVPQVDARLAYIGLLNSDEPANSDENVRRIDRLRQCAAGRQDFFSQIIIAKINFYHFIEEQERNDEISELPTKMWHFLELPCCLGHPVAVRFWNELLAYIGTPEAMNWRLGNIQIRENLLYDFYSVQTCK